MGSPGAVSTADARAALIATLEKQQMGCAGLGSAFYATLLGHLIDDAAAGGPVWDVLGPWSPPPDGWPRPTRRSRGSDSSHRSRR